MHQAFLKASSETKNSFWIKIRTGENTGKSYVEQTKLSWDLERGQESAWSLVEDILSILP